MHTSCTLLYAGFHAAAHQRLPQQDFCDVPPIEHRLDVQVTVLAATVVCVHVYAYTYKHPQWAKYMQVGLSFIHIGPYQRGAHSFCQSEHSTGTFDYGHCLLWSKPSIGMFVSNYSWLFKRRLMGLPLDRTRANTWRRTQACTCVVGYKEVKQRRQCKPFNFHKVEGKRATREPSTKHLFLWTLAVRAPCDTYHNSLFVLFPQHIPAHLSTQQWPLHSEYYKWLSCFTALRIHPATIAYKKCGGMLPLAFLIACQQLNLA